MLTHDLYASARGIYARLTRQHVTSTRVQREAETCVSLVIYHNNEIIYKNKIGVMFETRKNASKLV